MRIKSSFTNTQIIERSEFICYLQRCFTELEAREWILSIRKEHRDATHCCTAFVCGDKNQIMRSNDDGEPSGTAGSPMLDAIIKSGITDCAACVVRYFGGIKLGAGGLIRAYSKSVSQAIQLAPKVQTVLVDRYTCSFPYDLIGKIDFFLKDDCVISEKIYDEDVTYFFHTSNLNFTEQFTDFCNGQLPLHHLEQSLIEVDCPTQQ